jgi:hypothetical protein
MSSFRVRIIGIIYVLNHFTFGVVVGGVLVARPSHFRAIFIPEKAAKFVHSSVTCHQEAVPLVSQLLNVMNAFAVEERERIYVLT